MLKCCEAPLRVRPRAGLASFRKQKPSWADSIITDSFLVGIRVWGQARVGVSSPASPIPEVLLAGQEEGEHSRSLNEAMGNGENRNKTIIQGDIQTGRLTSRGLMRLRAVTRESVPARIAGSEVRSSGLLVMLLGLLDSTPVWVPIPPHPISGPGLQRGSFCGTRRPDPQTSRGSASQTPRGEVEGTG